MSNIVSLQASKLAATLGMGGENKELVETLKATAFRGQVSDAQMAALLVVANQYALNPWTREVYAFPDKNNGIVPVVGVDGWSRIINTHQQFDGMEFEQDAESCTCIIFRKDRRHPTKVTEWMSECSRNTGPWQSHPKRMLRHKAMIQCARLAFGYTGIFDQDEAERIVEAHREIDMGPAEVVEKKPVSASQSVKDRVRAARGNGNADAQSDEHEKALQSVIARIASASNAEELKAARTDAAKLPEPFKSRAAAVYNKTVADRRKASEQATVVDPETGEITQDDDGPIPGLD